jgi:hypothetical protein
MRLIYAYIGQPGSIYDTTVLYHALESDQDIFTHPPLGKQMQKIVIFFIHIFFKVLTQV